MSGPESSGVSLQMLLTSMGVAVASVGTLLWNALNKANSKTELAKDAQIAALQEELRRERAESAEERARMQEICSRMQERLDLKNQETAQIALELARHQSEKLTQSPPESASST